jgi:hypothetical protein
MKKIVFILNLVILCVFSKAQQTEFAPVGAKWHYTSWGDYSVAQYEVVRDSVSEINGKTYKIISGKSNEILYQENGKVYFLFENEQYLIYDFNATEDEIITFYAKSYDPTNLNNEIVLPVQYKIEHITQFIIDGHSYKQFETTLVPNDNYLLDEEYSYRANYIYNEKIGSEYYFILRVLPPSPAMNDDNLRCYSDNEISYTSPYWQMMGQGKPCDYNQQSSVSNINNDNVQLLINGTEKQITLESNLQNLDIELFNIQGISCLKKNFANTANKVLNISDLCAGIYVAVVCSSGQQVFSQKIVLVNNFKYLSL